MRPLKPILSFVLVAALTAVFFAQRSLNQVRESQPTTLEQLREAVSRGAAMRVRPKLMTVTTIFAGLAPIFVTTGLGSDVMRRIALPMLGGMTSTLLLTLVVIPVVYYLWVGSRLTAAAPSQASDRTKNSLPTEGL